MYNDENGKPKFDNYRHLKRTIINVIKYFHCQHNDHEFFIGKADCLQS